MNSRLADVLRRQEGRHLEHELFRAADEVLGRAVLKLQVSGLELGQVDPDVVGVGRDLIVVEARLEEVGAQVRVPRRQVAHVALEGALLPRPVHPGDGLARLALHGGVEDGEERRGADARRDQHDGHGAVVAGLVEEVTRRVRQLDHVALLRVVDECARYQPWP